MKAPFHAIATGVFGFLVPLALFHRWTRKWPRLHAPLVFAAAACGFAFLAPSSVESLGRALWGLASAACLFAAFYLAADLLAGLAALSCSMLGASVGTLLATAPFSLDVLVLFGAGLGVALAAWSAARHGRALRDEEVRPAYAANLAERLRLEQEIDATRTAQQRLLPVRFPHLDGLTVAAACLPARDVAGDFYDVFSLGDGRLAVFLAEGGGQRLARALSIALVKGYLMEKAFAGLSPAETIERLHAAAGRLVAGSTANLCFAVIDSRALTLRYARTGDWPAVLLRRTPDAPALACAEAVRESGGLSIMEGAATLEPSSLLLLYTDGIGRRRSLVRLLRRDRFDSVVGLLAASAVVAAVLGRLSKRARRKLDDDLALVAVRVNAIAAVRQAEVA
jgi:F0F1-type ATP synthase assembly protein I